MLMQIIAFLVFIIIVLGIPGLIIAFLIVALVKFARKPKRQNQTYIPPQSTPQIKEPLPKSIDLSVPQQLEKKPQPLPYVRKRLMSMNEAFFYYELKKITNKYNYELFTKVRIADLVETKQGLTRKQWGYYFGIIKAKHADFVICTTNLQPVLIIELDDSTHDTYKGVQRDTLVDNIYYSVNLPILHTRGIDNLEAKFCAKLNIREKSKTVITNTEVPCATASSLGVEPSAQ